MNSRSIIRAMAFMLIAGVCLLALSDGALAQCVMCRASVTGNGNFVRNLNIGVLVLLVPPVSIFCAIFIIAFRNRKS